MSKKTKILGAAAAVVVLVIAGTVATVTSVHAQTPTPTTATTAQADLLARVAQILGIDQQKLTDAFVQAGKEMAQDALTKALDKAVQEGRITQDQANQIKDWWNKKPDVLNGGVFPGLRGRGFGRGFMLHGFLGGRGDTTPTPTAKTTST